MKIAQINGAVWAFFLVWAVLHFSCKDDETTGDNLNDLRMQLAANVANNFILPAFENLKSEATSLSEAFVDFEGEMSVEKLEVVKRRLKSSWLTWQRASLFFFGPSETDLLRNNLNTYPVTVSEIEENIVSESYNFGSLNGWDAQGFGTLDYLLNEKEAAETLTDLQADNKRFIYLSLVASDVVGRINSTTEEWEQSVFIQNFTSANSSGTDVGGALSILINSMDIHFQRFVRDAKVAIPAGVRSAGIARPASVEAWYGGYSKELLLESLNAYLNLIRGGGDASLLSYLQELGQDELASRFEAELSEAIDLAKALNDPLSEQIEDDPDKVVNVFLELQHVVTALKSEVASVTGITITNQDSDGD